MRKLDSKAFPLIVVPIKLPTIDPEGDNDILIE